MSYLELESRQQDLTNNINTISDLISEAQLKGVTGNTIADLNTLQGKLRQENTFVTNELKHTVNKHTKLNRLLQINNYYSEYYNDKINIMKTIVVICILLIIVSILVSRGLIPQIAYKILVSIIIIVGIIYLGNQLMVFYSHDNMNYSQYKWNFNMASAPPINTSYPNGGNPSTIPTASSTTTCTK
jgi:hypothetical protein